MYFVSVVDMTIKGFELAVSTMTRNETSKFRCHPNYGYGSEGFEQIIPPHTWLTFEIQLLKWTWEDISRQKDGSITRQIIEPGVSHATPSNISLVNIHLEKEQNGLVVDERDLEFRLGEGKAFGICPGIEIALSKFKMKEKSRIFIHKKHTLLEFSENSSEEVYVIRLNFFEKVNIFKIFILKIIIYVDFVNYITNCVIFRYQNCLDVVPSVLLSNHIYMTAFVYCICFCINIFRAYTF